MEGSTRSSPTTQRKRGEIDVKSSDTDTSSRNHYISRANKVHKIRAKESSRVESSSSKEARNSSTNQAAEGQ